MARDRQRAKQRRRERQSGASGAAGRDDARDIGLDDATAADAGLGDNTPAPDPLKHSSADVDQAKLAEAGVARGESGDVEFDHDEHADAEAAAASYEPAPDEVEGDQPIRRGELDPSVAEEVGGQPPRSRNRVIAFLGHCIDELRRVQWPNRKQVFQATAVVLGFVVLAGGYLGLLDAVFKPLVQAIL